MKDIQAFYAKELPIPPPVILPPSLVLSQSPISYSQDFFPSEEILPKDTETSVSPSSSVGSSSPVRMPSKRTSTFETPAITLATIQRLITDGIVAALETRAINTNNTNRNLEPKETLVSKRGNYKDNCTEENKVSFATGILTNDALSWWNAYAQPIGIGQANKIAWTVKRLQTNKYCPQTKIKKMKDKFYNLVVKENDLKTYIRRFQELALLCPNMVPNSKKLIEVFIEGLPRSIERNVTASNPQTLEEVITITQRLMEQAFPLPGENSHWQYKFTLPVNVVPTARRLEMPLPGVCIAIKEMMKKLPVKDRWHNNMETQTYNTLHNAIMEAGSKDRPPMLAPGIDNDIYSTVDACPNACETWKAIKRLKQGESINVQDHETNLYWEFGKFTSQDAKSLDRIT
nr:reverse transcriptase domain-containing protein [Tanacetum cinerariifolium]